LATKFNCNFFSVAHEGKFPERWLYEKSKLVSKGLFVAGRLPERLLFPRNLIPSHFGSRIFANIIRRLKGKKNRGHSNKL
jgi:hypothetical protein